MLTLKHIDPDQTLTNGLALTFAAEALPIFEAACPNDPRPRIAVMALMQYLQGKFGLAQYNKIANTTAYDSDNAAQDLYHKYNNLTGISAAVAISFAVEIPYHADDLITVATSAAKALQVDRDQYIHDKLLQLLPLIASYKSKFGQPFNQADEVFSYLKPQPPEVSMFTETEVAQLQSLIADSVTLFCEQAEKKCSNLNYTNEQKMEALHKMLFGQTVRTDIIEYLASYLLEVYVEDMLDESDYDSWGGLKTRKRRMKRRRMKRRRISTMNVIACCVSL